MKKKGSKPRPKNHDYSKMDPDAISDKYSGQALDHVIAEKEREKKSADKKKAEKKKEK